MKVILSQTEIYRVDSEEEVQAAVEAAKEEANENGYILKGYSSKLKEKKSKGEVIDQGYEVKFTKEFNTFWEV